MVSKIFQACQVSNFYMFRRLSPPTQTLAPFPKFPALSFPGRGPKTREEKVDQVRVFLHVNGFRFFADGQEVGVLTSRRGRRKTWTRNEHLQDSTGPEKHIGEQGLDQDDGIFEVFLKIVKLN